MCTYLYSLYVHLYIQTHKHAKREGETDKQRHWRYIKEYTAYLFFFFRRSGNDTYHKSYPAYEIYVFVSRSIVNFSAQCVLVFAILSFPVLQLVNMYPPRHTSQRSLSSVYNRRCEFFSRFELVVNTAPRDNAGELFQYLSFNCPPFPPPPHPIPRFVTAFFISFLGVFTDGLRSTCKVWMQLPEWEYWRNSSSSLKHFHSWKCVFCSMYLIQYLFYFPSLSHSAFFIANPGSQVCLMKNLVYLLPPLSEYLCLCSIGFCCRLEWSPVAIACLFAVLLLMIEIFIYIFV